jgi:hypothetical protein
MGISVYRINKGVNRSIEFKGLKAQYIWYMGAGAVSLLSLFAAMYIVGINQWLCITITIGLGFYLTKRIYMLSAKYGEYGMMKMLARKNLPASLKCRGRRDFFIPRGDTKRDSNQKYMEKWRNS